MVKGTTRRVVVVKFPDPKLFDEAIFIVKEDSLRGGVTNEQILREAQETAARYIRSRRMPRRRLLSSLPSYAFIAIGAGAVAVIWILSSLL